MSSNMLMLIGIFFLINLDIWLLQKSQRHTFIQMIAKFLVYSGVVCLVFFIYNRIGHAWFSHDNFLKINGHVLLITMGTGLLGGGAIFGAALIVKKINGESLSFRLGKMPAKLKSWGFKKIAIVILQQIGLQVVVFPVSISFIGSYCGGVLVGAGLFSLLHAPNLFLMIATFMIVPFWYVLFSWSHMIFSVIISHLLLVVFLRLLLPDYVHLGLSVGIRAWARLNAIYWIVSHNLWSQVKYLTSDAFYLEKGGTSRDFIHGCFTDVLGVDEPDDVNQQLCEEMKYKTRTDMVIWFMAHPLHRQKFN